MAGKKPNVSADVVVRVSVSLHVQYMFKDLKTDIPKMGNLLTYSQDIEVGCPPDLVGFLDQYVKGVVAARNGDDVSDQSYGAGETVVKKWRGRLKRMYPDEFAGKLTDNEVIDGAISCSIEDAVKDAVETNWDSVYAPKLKAVPAVPDGYRLAGRFIHVEKWSVYA